MYNALLRRSILTDGTSEAAGACALIAGQQLDAVAAILARISRAEVSIGWKQNNYQASASARNMHRSVLSFEFRHVLTFDSMMYLLSQAAIANAINKITN